MAPVSFILSPNIRTFAGRCHPESVTFELVSPHAISVYLVGLRPAWFLRVTSERRRAGGLHLLVCRRGQRGHSRLRLRYAERCVEPAAGDDGRREPVFLGPGAEREVSLLEPREAVRRQRKRRSRR